MAGISGWWGYAPVAHTGTPNGTPLRPEGSVWAGVLSGAAFMRPGKRVGNALIVVNPRFIWGDGCREDAEARRAEVMCC